ncbi:MAG TPA: DUF4232 domain-containing protein, partial [Ktedonobacterales bacterium]|nr:DUF4232 domain-containing protein [Ktedonobacterales bacterium]
EDEIPMTRILRSALGVALLALALGGCDLSGLGAPSPQPTAPAATQAPTAASTATGVASDNCQPSQLTFTIHTSGGAAGHIGQMGQFTNSSTTTCTLYGFPGAVMLDSQHQPMTTHALWQTSAYMYSNQMKTLVTLTPGASAYFAVTWSDVTTGSATTCPTSSYLSVTPPNDFSVLTVADQINACDSNLIISPVEPTSFMGG